MSLEERRMQYKCKRYVTLDEIETWSETRKILGKKLYTKFNNITDCDKTSKYQKH